MRGNGRLGVEQRMFARGFVLAVLLLITGLAAAQTNEGQLAGDIVDNTGARVANASVTAKNEATGSTYYTTSTGSGSYRFPSIVLGRYTVTVTAAGFQSSVSTGVPVQVASVASLNVHLRVGSATETITVRSDTPTVETQSSDIGGTVTTRQILDLPLALGGVGALRAPEAFVFLVPGTTGPGTNNDKTGIFASKLGGGQDFGNEVLLDGASQTRSENGSSFDEESPSVEAISEFKVTTSTPAAEFGRTTGGIENFVTKSGTNNFHGAAFDIFRNEDLNANTWFNNGYKAYHQLQNDGQEALFNRGNDKKNDYGASLGGPVFVPRVYSGKDRSFFFFSWEQFRQKLGGQATSTVPTVAERGGDFSDRLIGGPTPYTNPCDGTQILNGQIFDPVTEHVANGTLCRTAFPGNKIPTGRFTTVAKNIAAYYPAPTNGALVNNYTLVSSSTVVNTTYTIRLDEVINDSNKIYGSYSSRENTHNNPANLTLPSPVDPITQIQDFTTHFGRGGWDHIFSPRMLNHLNLGFNRSNSINSSVAARTGIDFAKQLGIGNIQTGFPRINVDGYIPLSKNQSNDSIDNGVRVNDSVSYQHGRHNFKMGVDYRYQQYSAIARDGMNGAFYFTTDQTKVSKTGGNAGTGNGYASLLLGAVYAGGANIPFHQARWISSYWAGFVQDDFKVTNSLVLNLGVRYSVDQPRHEADNDTSNFSTTAIDPKSGTPGALVFASNCGGCNKRWADTWYKDIAPRIGFAYAPAWWNGKLAVRGGFATLYAPLQYSDFGADMRTGYTAMVAFFSNGFDPAFQIDSGLPAYKAGINLDPGQLDSGNASSPNDVGSFIKPAYGRPGQVNQWNIGVQQEVAKDLIVGIGYLGSSGAHLKSQEENINNIAKSNFALGDILRRAYSVSAPVAPGSKLPYAKFNSGAPYQQSLRPFPQYGSIATDCCLQNVGHSSYEALIASVERRFSQGLNLQASYTWAKTITNADSIINFTNGVAQEQDPFDSKSQKSISNQDIPHTFVVSYIYELPFGRNRRFLSSGNRFLIALISGFRIGGVQRYMSGEPTSFGCATSIPGWDNCIDFTRVPGSHFESAARRSGRLDPFRILKNNGTVPGPDPNVDSEFNGVLSTDSPGYNALQSSPAFFDQNQASNRIHHAIHAGPDKCADCDNGGFAFGDIPRVTGEVRNYPYINEDFSVIKETSISESSSLVLKLELLNAINRHVFATPDLNPGDQSFGVLVSTIDAPRNVQITARFQF